MRRKYFQSVDTRVWASFASGQGSGHFFLLECERFFFLFCSYIPAHALFACL